MLGFLPRKVKTAISKFQNQTLNEIRIRKDCPIVVYYAGGRSVVENVIITSEDIEEIVLTACKRSIYAYDEHIKRGFITTDDGVRIGLAGEIVKDNGKIVTIKNYNSLCVRVPNEIKNVASEFFNKVYRGGSVIVIAPAGVGKTTFIRDLTRYISNNLKENVVVVDERNEIASNNGNKRFNLGDYTDVLTYSDKSFGFNQAVRTLNPNTIVTDELMTKEDVDGVLSAVYSGANVIATAHADSVENLLLRKFARELKIYKVFDYYVVISNKNGARTFTYFNKDFQTICL